MRMDTVTAGFVALVDSAPLIIAREMGFAAEEQLNLELVRAPSWATLRDMLALGQIEAAHMLSPIPVAMALGLGGVKTRLDALSVMSVNGPVIGVSRRIEQALRDIGYRFDFHDAASAAAALNRVTNGPLRIGVPFPFSMHLELLHYWMAGLGLPDARKPEIKTVPPPMMVDAMAADEIDAFCVGEPWGSIAVETGIGALLLPGSAIWGFEPDKVLAVRHDWAEAEEDLTGRLLRAVWRAGRWLNSGGRQTTAAEILARPEYTNVAPEVIDRALTGRLVISTQGEERHVERFMEFFEGAATFPWRSQAAWIARQMALRSGLDPVSAMLQAKQVFRTDLYRHHLQDVAPDLPGASEKLEGAINRITPAASVAGKLFLMPDTFFDGQIFDPAAR